MSRKEAKIAALVKQCEGQDLDARYLGFFECFNQQLFFEAHEVLEDLWLKERGGPKDLFYKGLIQLAGAFVHIQKDRKGPAIALFELARKNLKPYPNPYEQLDLERVLQLIDRWAQRMASTDAPSETLRAGGAPAILLGK